MEFRSRHSVAPPNSGVREQVKATVKNVLRRKKDEDDLSAVTPRSSRRQSSTDDLGDEATGRWNQLFRRNHHNMNTKRMEMGSSSSLDPGVAQPVLGAQRNSMWKKAISKIHNKSADSDISTKATECRLQSTSPSLHAMAKSSTSFKSAGPSRTSVARVAAVSTTEGSIYNTGGKHTDRSTASMPHHQQHTRNSLNSGMSSNHNNNRAGRKTGVSEVVPPRVRGASRPREQPITPAGARKAQPASTPPTSTTSLHHSSANSSSTNTGMLTNKGTPADLTRFFQPKPWQPSRWTVQERLAPAIHGHVSLYHDNLENKDVVVKQLKNEAVRPRGPQELENPLVEIGAMTYLFSEKALYPVDMVAKLEGVYQDDKFTYMVSEYCSEGELFKEVVRRKNLSERHVKAIALQLALALYSLHRNGICHRDVSLENTLIQSDHTVRLIDFGQAECCYEPDGSVKMMHGSAGKAYYRAPEMLRGPYCGPPVDVFALGVEIFIMAIGSPPWAKASLQDQRYRNLTKYRTSLDISLRKWGKRDGLSDPFVDILSIIFTSTPTQRPTIEKLLCHPWFSYDASVWTWVDQRSVSCTIREHAMRVEIFLKSQPQGAIEQEEVEQQQK